MWASLLKHPPPPKDKEGSLLFRAAPTHVLVKGLRVLWSVGVPFFFAAFWSRSRDFMDMPDGGGAPDGVLRLLDRFSHFMTSYGDSTLVILGILGPIIYAYFDRRFRWYTVRPDSLTIRSGIFTFREQTMSYHNIQNVKLVQGPLQRLMGVASVDVQAAGGAGGGNVARFENVAEAEEVVRLVEERQRRAQQTAPETTEELPVTLLRAQIEALRTRLASS